MLRTVALLALAQALAACAGGSATVARVGDAAITASALSHEMAVLSSEAHASASQALRQEALQRLISGRWLTGELARWRIHLSDREIAQRVRDRQWLALAESERAGARRSGSSKLSASDLWQAAVMELTSERLRLRAQRVPPPTAGAIRAYYEQHRREFLIPEEREIEVTNRKHAGEVTRLRSQIERRQSATATLMQRWTLARPAPSTHWLDAAVFAARPDVLTGPVKVRVDYFLFDVKRIVPARYRSLTEVAASIEQRLTAAREREALVSSVRRWRKWWRERTDCRPRYVVQKCRQYRGRSAPEDDTAFT